jgi:hypothetical protein
MMMRIRKKGRKPTVPLEREAAMQILDDVFVKYIKGMYALTFDDKKQVIHADTKNQEMNLHHSWALAAPDLTEDLLYLDACAFCALVIRSS